MNETTNSADIAALPTLDLPRGWVVWAPTDATERYRLGGPMLMTRTGAPIRDIAESEIEAYRAAASAAALRADAEAAALRAIAFRKATARGKGRMRTAVDRLLGHRPMSTKGVRMVTVSHVGGGASRWNVVSEKEGSEDIKFRERGLVGTIGRDGNGLLIAELFKVIDADTDHECRVAWVSGFTDLDAAQDWIEITAEMF